MGLSWGIVGIGAHADQFMAPGIVRAPGNSIAAVCSRDAGRAAAFATKHGAPRSYTDYASLLRDPSVQAIYIASPNFLHADHTVAAAAAGKHVLCDKPLAMTLEDCTRMIHACARANVTLATGFHMRTHPAHQQMRRLVAEGAPGKIVAVDAMWSIGTRGMTDMPPRTGLRDWWNHPEQSGGGAMYGSGIHVLDLLRFIMNDEVSQVFAFTDAHPPEQPLDLMTTAMLRFRSGVQATMKTSRIMPDPRNGITAYGVQQRIACIDTFSIVIQGDLAIMDAAGERIQHIPQDDPFKLQVEAFAHAVEHKTPPPATGLDGYRAAEISLAIFESARTGKMITLQNRVP
ncbi:MAG: Gfo/Idh/MocA family oxidoreductase [Dehalococcoidia bacterium]|nr:Gfo/Idh/MocA family oxidoreductase [Dehalococcoidia bacterium]